MFIYMLNVMYTACCGQRRTSQYMRFWCLMHIRAVTTLTSLRMRRLVLVVAACKHNMKDDESSDK